MNLPANLNAENFPSALRLIQPAKSPAFAVCAVSRLSGSRHTGSRCSGSQAPAWEPRSRSSSFARREAGASDAEFPSWSLGTSDKVLGLGGRV
jgi:hypothetical protein